MTDQPSRRIIHCAQGAVEIDLDASAVTKAGETVNLTRTEWRVLEILSKEAPNVVESSELLFQLYGPEYREDVQYLRVWVSRLRQKVEPEPGQPAIVLNADGGYFLLPD